MKNYAMNHVMNRFISVLILLAMPALVKKISSNGQAITGYYEWSGVNREY